MWGCLLVWYEQILCLSWRTTVTSAHHLCIFSRIQKESWDWRLNDASCSVQYIIGRALWRHSRSDGMRQSTHRENDRDVSAYSRGRFLISRVLHVCYSRVQKRIPALTHKWCVLKRISIGTPSDITVVLGMRQSNRWLSVLASPYVMESVYGNILKRAAVVLLHLIHNVKMVAAFCNVYAMILARCISALERRGEPVENILRIVNWMAGLFTHCILLPDCMYEQNKCYGIKIMKW